MLKEKQRRSRLAVFLVIALLCPYFMTIMTESVRVLAEVTEIPVKGVCTANELNIRSGPGTEYEQVTVNGKGALLVKNQEVELLGKENGWYKLRTTFEGETVTGYSLGTYIKVTETVTPTPSPTPTPVLVESTTYQCSLPAVITANELNFRTAADTASDILMTLKKNDEVTVIAQKVANGRKWYKLSIKTDGKTQKGYAVSDYIRFTYEKEFCVKTTGKINLFQNAGSTQAVMNANGKAVSLSKGTILSADAEETVDAKKWFHVSTQGTGTSYSGYVEADSVTILGVKKTVLVTPTPTPEGEEKPTTEPEKPQEPTAEPDKPTQTPEEPNGAQAVVTAGELNLRKQADVSSEVLVLMKKDQSVQVAAMLQKNGRTWCLLTAVIDGKTYRGYAVADYIKLLTPMNVTPTPTPTPTATSSPTMSPTPTPTSTPTPSPTPYYEVIDRGMIEGADELALKEIASYNSRLVKDAGGYPVVVDAGMEFDIIGYEQGDDTVWCHIRVELSGEAFFGYIGFSFLKVLEKSEISNEPEPTPTPTPVDETDFEAMLEAQNFPESYRESLRVIHAQHPTWKFVADHTGLDWDLVIENESVVGENLIPNSKGVEWKSLEPNAYNWKTDSFIPYDGSSWVTASKEAVSYYMDPRNFLDETNIFQFELLTFEPAYQTLGGVECILNNTALSGTTTEYINENGETASMTYAEVFMSAAQYSGVSPFHLASRVKQEVVIGTSSLSNSVTGKVAGFEGLYNFFNIGAYHSTVAGGAIANGLKYAKNGSTNAALNEKMMIPWNNPYRSIHGGAYYIGYSYIGRGQNTIYLQKFNVTPTSTYHHQYMANVEAPYSEGRRVANAYKEFGELPLVFSIPVYLNMPENACPIPAPAYNPNNWLKTLKVLDENGKDLELTPKFDLATEQDYYLVVDKACSMIQIKADTVSQKASVEGIGVFALSDDVMVFTVRAIAQNGDIREYRITVAKSES